MFSLPASGYDLGCRKGLYGVVCPCKRPGERADPPVILFIQAAVRDWVPPPHDAVHVLQSDTVQ